MRWRPSGSVRATSSRAPYGPPAAPCDSPFAWSIPGRTPTCGPRPTTGPWSSDPFELQDDLAARVVATVGDSNGVLARSLAASLKDRNADELTVGELVMRSFGYAQHFRPKSICGFERRSSAHWSANLVMRWAGPVSLTCMSTSTRSCSTSRRSRCNAVPRPPSDRSSSIPRARPAGGLWRRSFLRTGSQRSSRRGRAGGCTQSTARHCHERDRLDAPLRWRWDRGVELVARAIDLNPHTPGLAAQRPGDESLSQRSRQGAGSGQTFPICRSLSGRRSRRGCGRTTRPHRRCSSRARRHTQDHPEYIDPNKCGRCGRCVCGTRTSSTDS